MALTWIDAVFLAVLALSMLAGFVRGFVRESLGLAAWVVALMVAAISSTPLSVSVTAIGASLTGVRFRVTVAVADSGSGVPFVVPLSVMR